MGVKGGVGVWCLLLAGLLLLAVASAAERDTKKEKEEEIRWCKEDCDWKAGEDTGKARECKEQCERRRHGHELLQEDGDSFDRCVSKCRGHGGWWGKERWDRCRQICRQSQEGEGGDDDLDEGGGNADDSCEQKCQQRYRHEHDKQQCVRDCKSGGGGGAGGRGREGDERQHGREMVVEAILEEV
uniref:Plant antimicrobial peptide domain-containing protein n=1 Tax=Aegilops tauschii TaxID=37682 RepID=N1QQN2_AEGTA